MAEKRKRMSRKDAPPTTAAVGFKKPPLHKAIKKGEVRNPHGYSKPKEVRALEMLTEKIIGEVVSKVMNSSKQELMNMLKDPDLPLAHRVIIKAALKAEKDDSFYQLNEILNRAIGTVKQKLDHTSSDGSMSPSQSVQFYIPENKRQDEKP